MSSSIVSLLFCDIVGSTALLSRLGDEAGDAVRRTVFDALRAAVAGHGGEEVKNLGDGLMVAFSSASEAVACGAAMQRAMERLRRRGGDTASLELRVGVSAGEATREDDDWFGTPVVEAARLCAAAEAGEILVADVMRLLTGSRAPFAFSAPADYELKGLAGPLAACRVEWREVPEEHGRRLPLALSVADGLPFVGRADERELLRQAWKRAREGARTLALVAGEPGAGKTRLSGELAREALDDDALVLFGRCDEELGVPFQPFAEALRAFAEQVPAAELPALLGRHGGELRRLVPDLSRLAPELPEPMQSDPQTEQYRLFDAVSSWLAAASAERPMLLVLDDLHWAGKPTLLLLRHLLRHAEPMALLVLGTYRDSDLGGATPLTEALGELHRIPAVERVTLSGLDEGEVAALVQEAAGAGAEGDVADVARTLVDETSGNPFFLGELLRHLGETGGLRAPGGVQAVPQGVREVVSGRVTRLSADAEPLLRVAAVIGQEFDVAVLAQAAETDARQVEDVLDQALRAHLLVEAEGHGLRLRFAHALVRATLYEQLAGLRRVRLHRQVAEAMERVHAGRLEGHASALAHHWGEAAEGGAVEEAAHWAMSAGDEALAQLADEQALHWYERAEALLDRLGEADSARRCDLGIRLAEAGKRVGREYRPLAIEAARLAQRLEDPQRTVDALLTASRGFSGFIGQVDRELVGLIESALRMEGLADGSRARLLAFLASELRFGEGNQDRLLTLARDAIDLARELGAAPVLLEALVLGGVTLWVPDNAGERLALAEEIERVSQEVADPRWRCYGLAWRCAAHLERAEFDQARAALAELRTLADALGQPTLKWLAASYGATEANYRGEYAEGKALAEAAVAHGMAGNNPDTALWAGCHLFDQAQDVDGLGSLADVIVTVAEQNPNLVGWTCGAISALLEGGRREEGERMLDAFLASGVDRLPWDLNWMGAQAGLVRAAHLTGRRDLAERLYEVLLPFDGLLLFHPLFVTGDVSLALGQLALVLGDTDRALAHLEDSLELHERAGSPRWAAHARREIARALLARDGPGDAERARAALDRATRTAEDLGMRYFAERTAAMLP